MMADEDSESVDTGFDAVYAGEKWEEVTAAVTNPIEPPAPEPIGLTEDGRQAAKALVQLPDMSYTDLAQLARDIALDVKEHHVVLTAHGLTEAQYEFLEHNNEFYIAALRAACLEWHAPLSTQERVKITAAAILEDSLPGLGSRMQNPREQLPGVIEAAKLFAKVAGVGERDAGTAAPGERFTINIDLGSDQKLVVQSGPAPQQLAPASGAGSARSDSKVEGDSKAT